MFPVKKQTKITAKNKINYLNELFIRSDKPQSHTVEQYEMIKGLITKGADKNTIIPLIKAYLNGLNEIPVELGSIANMEYTKFYDTL
jgi:hypothetical protein